MTPTRSLALTAALALTVFGAPATRTIAIVGSAGPGAFNPNPVTVASGDVVTWTNSDVTVHHIVLDDGSYDSGTLTPGASSPATAITATGSYHCTIHPSMTGTITVSPACAFAIAPTAASIAAPGAAGTVSVTAGAACAWTATSNSSFITVLSGAAGSGNGTVSYSVAANPSTSARSGSVTIAGQTFTVTQAGAPACPAIVIAPSTLGTMTQGSALGVSLSASGGTAPYSFSVSSGSPPAGLALSTGGLLSGTPTTPGTSTFSARATDAAGCAADMPYSVTVLPSVPSMPQTVVILFAIAVVTAGWWYLGRRRGAWPS